MAEDMGDKTEAPTPRRRQEARDAGNIARSHDLVSSALLIAILYLLRGFGPNLVASLRNMIAEMLSSGSLNDLSGRSLGALASRNLIAVGLAMGPVLAGVMLVAVAANLAQTGFYFNPARLQPHLAALSPMRGLSRMFSPRGPGATRIAMMLLKMVLVSWAAYSAVAGRLGSIVQVQQLAFMQIFALGADVIFSIALRIGIVLLVLAVLDYIVQRFNIERQLRMSKTEVKEEMKSMEGDPKVKMRRRQIAMQRARDRLKKEVPTADVIITNPTHFAVALKYDAAAMHAPRVVAKGADLMARRIRELAAEHGIPIVERATLARAIYRLVDVGQEIPEQFYAAIAEILAYVYELSGKAKRKAAV